MLPVMTDTRYSPDAPPLSYPPTRRELWANALFHVTAARPGWADHARGAFATDYADTFAGSIPPHALDFLSDYEGRARG